jgi:hypothetical protein
VPQPLRYSVTCAGYVEKYFSPGFSITCFVFCIRLLPLFKDECKGRENVRHIWRNFYSVSEMFTLQTFRRKLTTSNGFILFQEWACLSTAHVRDKIMAAISYNPRNISCSITFTLLLGRSAWSYVSVVTSNPADGDRASFRNVAKRTPHWRTF